MIFYVEPKTIGRIQAVGEFAEGERYPVVQTYSDQMGGLRFHLVDDSGDFVDLPAEYFRFVGTTKGKPGRPVKDAPA